MDQIVGSSHESTNRSKKFPIPKKVVIILSIAVPVVVSLVQAGFIIKKHVIDTRYGNSNKKPTICDTFGCETAARYLKSSMNLSANPCDDFFNYVCGGWLKINEKRKNAKPIFTVADLEELKIKQNVIKLLTSSEKYSSNSVVGKAQRFFKKCTRRKRSNELKGIRKVVKDFGGFSMYDEKTYDQNLPWYVRTARVIRNFGFQNYDNDGTFKQGVIFNFRIDAKDGLTLVKPSTYYSSTNFEKANYPDMVKSSVCNVLRHSCDEQHTRKLSKRIEKFVKFRRKMAQCVNARDSQYKKKLTIAQFTADFPYLRVYEFFTELFRNTASKVTESTEFVLSHPYYWGNVSQLVKITDQEVIDNFIGWSNFEILHYTRSPTATSYRRFFADETFDNNERKTHCLALTENVLRLAVSRLYIDHYVRNELKDEVGKIFQRFKHAFVELVREKEWLSENAKKETIGKIKILEDFIGYPAWLKSDAILERYYSLKEPLPNSSFIEMYRSLASFQVGEVLTQLDYPHYKNNEWSLLYAGKNVNSYDFNDIVLPIVQISPPILWTDATTALEYGAASSTIGQAVVRAVQPAIASWDETSKKNIVELIKCLEEQYRNFTDPGANLHLNSENAKVEFFVDNGGLRVGYEAYLTNDAVDERLPGLDVISGDMLFFIGAGTKFCGYYSAEVMKRSFDVGTHLNRAFLPSSNMEEFWQIFNCPEVSRVNNKHKCAVW